MKLIVPYVGAPCELDSRLIRLAEFQGVPYEALALPQGSDPSAFLQNRPPEKSACLVVNPAVVGAWLGGGRMSAELAALLLSRFPRILVHGLRVEEFDSQLIDVLTGGRLRSVGEVGESGSAYSVAPDAGQVCEAFAGLSFGTVNAANDHILTPGAECKDVQPLISIGGRPFMAAVRFDAVEILVVASENVADLESEAGEAPIDEYFSRLLPHAMALRYFGGDECWRPGEAYASIIIDDPLLRTSYGFLNFDALLQLAKEHNFHTTIAFIPHNFRRNSSRILRMFKANPERLSICFHGNDHTSGELASTNTTLLNTMMDVAQRRMKAHGKATGLSCDPVMVFPQGHFSVEVMKVLKAQNFFAAVNTTPHPKHEPNRLSLRELASPAVLRYGGFPLFLRRPIKETQKHDLAFNLFFGRPLLIVEHHDVFQRPESLAEVAAMINSVAPNVRWTNLSAVVSNSTLTRISADGTRHIRAYSASVGVSNAAETARRYAVAWQAGDGAPVDQALIDGVPGACATDDAGTQVMVEVPAGSSRTISLVHRNEHAKLPSLGLKWKTHAFLRRRLSEFRDNYLSKNDHILTAARTLQRRFLA